MIRFLQAAGTALVLFFASFSPSRAMPDEAPQDIVFVFDASGNLGAAGYQTVLDYMSAIVLSVTGDPAHAQHPTRFGAIRFSTGVQTIYNLTDDQTPSVITSVPDNVAYPQGTTHTRDTLNRRPGGIHRWSKDAGRVCREKTPGAPGRNRHLRGRYAALPSGAWGCFSCYWRAVSGAGSAGPARPLPWVYGVVLQVLGSARQS